ncbi:Proteasome subunit beta type-4 [Lathyrus oleraceus]|nr:Proteasome subunit beta type-4 [Pisum sativum]
MWDDGNSLGPKEVHNYLTRVMYNRRNKFNPLWNSLVLGGIKKGQKYLGTVNMIGINYEDNHVATGLGNHLARPILRDEWNENLSFEEGVRLLEKCMRVLLYRDRSAVNKIQVCPVSISCCVAQLISVLFFPLPIYNLSKYTNLILKY